MICWGSKKIYCRANYFSSKITEILKILNQEFSFPSFDGYKLEIIFSQPSEQVAVRSNRADVKCKVKIFSTKWIWVHRFSPHWRAFWDAVFLLLWKMKSLICHFLVWQLCNLQGFKKHFYGKHKKCQKVAKSADCKVSMVT